MSMSNVQGPSGLDATERREGQQPVAEGQRQEREGQRPEDQGQGQQGGTGERREREGQAQQPREDQRREEEGQPREGERQQPQAQRGEGRLPEPSGRPRGREDAGDHPQRRAQDQEILGWRPISSGDDLAIESPHLKVDELSLELQGNIGIERINLTTKGLDAELYVRANLENVVGIVEAARNQTSQAVVSSDERPASEEGGQAERDRAKSSQGIRGELQRALESAKSATERVAAPDLRDELQGAYDVVRRAFRQIVSETGHDGGETRERGGGQAEQQQGHKAGQEGNSHSAGERAKHLARSPGAAAVAGAVAGFAGSKAHMPSGKHGIRDHLPGRMGSDRRDLVGRATAVPGEIMKTVGERLS
jgi:hypothetical protein